MGRWVHRQKHKREQYELNREGLESVMADVKLMCDNCRLYNEDSEEYVGYANEMEAYAKEASERELKKALAGISGRRA